VKADAEVRIKKKTPLCNETGDLCPVHFAIPIQQRSQKTDGRALVHATLKVLAKLGEASQNLFCVRELRDCEAL
jgi:hypothetical protein